MPIQQIPQLQNISSYIPTRYTYNGSSIQPSIRADRVTVRTPSSIAQITPNSTQAIFDINNSATADFSKMALGFTMSISGSATAAASNNIATMIQRVRVLFDSEVIEDLNNYGLFSDIISYNGDPDYGPTIGSVLLGWKNYADRVLLAPGHSYITPLLIGSLAARALPLNRISARLRIEVYFGTPQQSLEDTAASSPSYQISDLNLFYDEIRFDSGYHSQLENQMKADGHITIPFISFENFTNSLTNSGASVLQINFNLKNLLSVF